jgi:Zn-dependent membrane protease YugP
VPIVAAIAGLIVLAIVFGPQLWVRHVLARHATDRPDLPGTGGELARHLLDEAGLRGVAVEITDAGDHYDPEARAVRLLPQHYAGRSVAAVAVATHEVSHAIQHARGERPFALRFALVKRLVWIERIAGAILLLAPVVFVLLKAPIALVLQLGLGILLLAIRVVVHAATLPVEIDASFGKALPLLERGHYLPRSDLPAARSVLRAAAYTYVAASLATLLDVMRWIKLLRF